MPQMLPKYKKKYIANLNEFLPAFTWHTTLASAAHFAIFFLFCFRYSAYVFKIVYVYEMYYISTMNNKKKLAKPNRHSNPHPHTYTHRRYIHTHTTVRLVGLIALEKKILWYSSLPSQCLSSHSTRKRGFWFCSCFRSFLSAEDKQKKKFIFF